MKARRLFILLACLPILAAAPAEATCTRTGGGFWWFQHLYDQHFEELGANACAAWTLTGDFQLGYNADGCGSSLQGYMPVITGDSNGAIGTFYQDIDLSGAVNPDSSWNLQFHTDRLGSMTNWDYLKVTIRDPSDNSLLETVALIRGNDSDADCGSYNLTLTGQYSGETIRIYFEGYVTSTSSADGFVVDWVALNEVYPS